ncbi:RNA exonuclease 4 isoform X2 [Tripterygium wilfordii]|uniref:RNA exonuclease 4 isoform X2 n=1 Tax=Tripterygium wilfordii TaxID=458696 RepID=UPI0018F7E677|nr:RNA exonuclease 4 isoform X2 [Tripterygium wilfordii]
MGTEANPLITRHKCSACFKQFKRKEHLVEHMKISYHSVHQPRCPVCLKHCKSFESVREHLNGPLQKPTCSEVFSVQGCNLCLKVYNSSNSLHKHKEICCLASPVPLGTAFMHSTECQVNMSVSNDKDHNLEGLKGVAMDCEMVGGGSDGSIDICARVCLVDEDENIIFYAYVQPEIPVTNYRYELTGLTKEHLKDAVPLMEVKDEILKILYNGEPVERLRLDGGKARLLVGHSLEHDLYCLRMKYPVHLLRDTAKYQPLMKTNLVSHSLKYDIQTAVHDPYEDCVSVMRLYKRMRSQDHQMEGMKPQNLSTDFDSLQPEELEKMSPDELYEISRPNYRCWCLDSK